MIFPLTSLVVVGGLLVLRSRDEGRHGVALALWFWAVSLVLCALPVLTYTVDYSLKSDAFMAASLTALSVGYLAVRRKPMEASSVAAPSRRSETERTIISGLGWLGLIGNGLLLVVAVRNGIELSVGFLTRGLAEIRANSFDTAANGLSGGVAVAGSLLSPAAYMYVAAAAKQRANRLLLGANIVLIILAALFYFGGRQSIVVAALLVLVGLWLRGIRVIRLSGRQVLAAAVALLAGWYFVSAFVSSRQGSESGRDPGALLRVVSHAEYGEWTARRVAENPTLGSLLIQYSYFSSPAPALTAYMSDGDAVPGPLWGQYSFPLPAIFITQLQGTYSADAWADARTEVFAPFAQTGFLDNAWATGLRDLLADFTAYGAVLFYLLLGLLLARARNRAERTSSTSHHLMETYLAVAVAFGAFQSLFYTDYFGYGLLYVLVLAGWRGLDTREARNSPEPRLPSPRFR
jgi:hypothetical protein